MAVIRGSMELRQPAPLSQQVRVFILLAPDRRRAASSLSGRVLLAGRAAVAVRRSRVAVAVAPVVLAVLAALALRAMLRLPVLTLAVAVVLARA